MNSKWYLVIFNVLLTISLIVLTNTGLLPLNMGDFIFFTVLSLAFALYRPSWSFLLFIGLIPLENISLAPESVGIIVRPYQLLAAVTMVAIIVRYMTGRLNFRITGFKWYDNLVLLMLVSSFISALASTSAAASIKMSIILSSFAAIYFLTRIYIQTIKDISNIMPFILSTGVVVALYSLWQNVRFLSGASHFEIMPGRPNSTFSEPDWFGLYLVIILAVLYSALLYLHRFSTQGKSMQVLPYRQNEKIYLCFVYAAILFVYAALVVTVSRSAWLGAFIVTFIFVFLILTGLRYRHWQWAVAGIQSAFLSLALVVSILLVMLIPLTDFQLGNRLQSTGTGLQEITISCENCAKGSYGPNGCNWKPVPITDTLILPDNESLADYHCRHIDLEEIDHEVALGNFVTKAMRKDPNINIRQQIYGRSWELIQEKPIVGIGWGSIGDALGKDDRGTALNTSNIFFELWLGAGLLALISFIVILVLSSVRAISHFFYCNDYYERAVYACIFLGIFALIVPNLFNAGILLAYPWVFLAIAQIKKNA
jgi:hypothetical protein